MGWHMIGTSPVGLVPLNAHDKDIGNIMAVVAGIKIKTKVAKPRGGNFADEKYTGTEPEWPADAKDWPEDKFDNLLRRSFYYYNYYYSQKDCKKYVVEWMKGVSEFTKEEVKAFERSSDKSIPMTACSLIMAHRQGMPLRPRHIEFLDECIVEAISKDTGEELTPETEDSTLSKAYTPTIQDRLNEKTSELIGELEGMYDDMTLNKAEKFKPYDWLSANNVVQSQLGKYEDLYNKRKAELIAAQGKEDPQLKEGYSHYKAADFKRCIGWIDDLLAGVEQYRGFKKATKKAAVKKAPSKEKLVAKLKYAKEDKALKIVSINPADIIGAGELWVYNTKTRKLGKYVAAAYQQLGIKGTTITGFDSDKSVCKTLRKPDEKLKEFAKAGKIQLRKFLEEIKSTETKMTGRINEDIVLLRTA